MKPPRLGPGSTIVVDREVADARIVSRWLDRAGHTVSTVSTPAECLEAVEQSVPDLILGPIGLVEGNPLSEALFSATRERIREMDDKQERVFSRIGGGQMPMFLKPAGRIALEYWSFGVMGRRNGT